MLINTEIEFLYYFALEFVDTVEFIKTRGSFINFIKI